MTRCIIILSSVCVISLCFAGSGWILRLSPNGMRANLPKLVRIGPDGRFGYLKDLSSIQAVAAFGTLQPNFEYLQMGTTDPDFKKSWGLFNFGQLGPSQVTCVAGKDIGLSRSWDIYSGDPDVAVAVLDTGLALSNTEFNGRVWTNSRERENGIDDDENGYVDDINGWNFIDGNSDVNDDGDHGTFVSGIIAANQNTLGTHGVLRSGLILPVKVLDAGGFTSTKTVIQAIEYAVNAGARVVNLSIGGNQYDPALLETIEWADSQGVLFIAAAGNSAKSNDTSQHPIYPASFQTTNLISVAAYDCRDRIWREKNKGSNYGKRTVHVGAPGVEVFSATPTGFRYGSGTSFSAPFVSGVAALVRGLMPQLTPLEVRERILNSSEVISFYEKEYSQSGGRLRADWALEGRVIPRPKLTGTWQKTPYQWNSQSPYQNDLHESLQITISGARAIRIVFSAFETEESFDVLTLTDAFGDRVFQYSGNLGGFTGAEVMGESVIVDFDSDTSTVNSGVKISEVEALY